MKLSDQLYDKVRDLWQEAAAKPFVIEMAKGTLDEDRFRRYMIQDYLYLLDYIDILKDTMSFTEDFALKAFLRYVTAETEKEIRSVHVPNMKLIGVSEREALETKKMPVISEYVGYMKGQLSEVGLLAGLTALLQCSWVYAYIGEAAAKKYAGEISRSPYRSWFDAYTGSDYRTANRRWIDVLDEHAGDITPDERERLARIFVTCAEYENRFWDELYK